MYRLLNHWKAILSTSTLTTTAVYSKMLQQAHPNLTKNPQAFIAEAIDETFEVQFQGVSGPFELDISFAAGGTFRVPLTHDGLPLDLDVNSNPNST